MPWTFPYLDETEELDEAARASAAGDFVRLPDGYTHYELGGPQDGAVVVLVHGFSVPYFIFDPTFEFLTRSGLRVLRYDLFGRGFSDRPKLRYDIDLFCKQLQDLLDILGLVGCKARPYVDGREARPYCDDPVSLVGLSMGGPIAATFTARFPQRVRRLVLIDPAGARPVSLPWGLRAATLPGVGELAIGLFGSVALLKDVAAGVFGPDLVAEFQRRYRVQMKYKGFRRALLSTMRHGMLGDFSAVYRRVGESGVPVLLFWGEDDVTVPFSYSHDICAAIPQADFQPVAGCGHTPHYEKPEKVNPRLLAFLE
jgi:pimeloyl-ACP methyl ester carboxylesterase